MFHYAKCAVNTAGYVAFLVLFSGLTVCIADLAVRLVAPRLLCLQASLVCSSVSLQPFLAFNWMSMACVDYLDWRRVLRFAVHLNRREIPAVIHEKWRCRY